MFKIGKVTHYYDKIKVAIVELSGDLLLGDKVKFTKGDEDLFEQTVNSIQIEHKKVESAGKGDVIGLEVNEEAKEGTEVYKIS
ncbi:MAG: translation elongation factor-like protein [Candidatus Woesebacteria bacterium]|nr:translation elongation factor-like protein [Candidatus Woesebacteria bacterium]